MIAKPRADVVAEAFTKQMEGEANGLRAAKAALEASLAEGKTLSDPIKQLDSANEAYKKASVNVRKHTTVPKAKKGKKLECLWYHWAHAFFCLI